MTETSVGEMLRCSMGLSAWKQHGAARWALRVNPSSGNLHPTEAYVLLPTDGTTAVALGTDSWNNLPLGCGVGQTLTEAKTACFQVCVDAVGTTGGVCLIGNTAELSSWGAGVPMTAIGTGLYQACIVFPAGMAIPQNLEYKFKKDDCATWESVGNRTFTVDNAAAAETNLTSNWDNGAGTCLVVPAETQTWGGLKSLFR